MAEFIITGPLYELSYNAVMLII